MEISLKRLFKGEFNRISNDSIYLYDLKYPGYNNGIWVKPYLDELDDTNDNNLDKCFLKCLDKCLELYIKNNDCKFLPLFKNIGNTFDKNNPLLLNLTTLEFIKYRKDCRIFTIWPQNILKKDTMIQILNKIAKIYTFKKINISRKAALSLVYQVYSHRGFQTYDELEQKVSKLGFIDNKLMYDITVILVEPTNNLLKFTLGNKEINEHLTCNFLETIQLGQIYFHDNSIKLLETQILDEHMHFRMWKSRVMFQTLRKWLYQNISLRDMNHVLLFSSIVLFIHGLRNCSDIDLLIFENIKNFSSETNSTIMTNLIEEKIFFFLDSSVKGTTSWKYYWDTWLNEWATLSGLTNFSEVLYDPRNYFYFMGMKIIDINIDIVRRIRRSRPRAIVDLCIIKDKLKIPINIPLIPKYQENFKKIITLTSDSIKKIIDNGGKYHENQEDIIEYVKTDTSIFIDTMIWCYKVRYNIVISKDNIIKYFANLENKKFEEKDGKN